MNNYRKYWIQLRMFEQSFRLYNKYRDKFPQYTSRATQLVLTKDLLYFRKKVRDCRNNLSNS